MTIQWPGLFFIAWGLYMFSTALSRPDGYTWNFRSRLITSILGKKGARIFFVGLGVVIVIFGSLVLFTIFDAGDDAIKWKWSR
jgi:hypothetical protein